ncbi:MAG: hypothetical protein ACJATF_000456 [Flavobacteriales bacterium]
MDRYCVSIAFELLAAPGDNEKLTSRFGNDYVNQNDHRESGLYNCFHEKNREIIFVVILI